MKIKYCILVALGCILFHFDLHSQFPWWCYDDDTRKTPNDTDVDVREWNGVCTDWSSTQSNAFKNAALAYWGDDPNFEYQGIATGKYNCHAYAWHVSEGGDWVWINTPNDDKYWEDGSYVKADPTEATKISYGDCPDQSATLPCFKCNQDYTYCYIGECDYEDNDFLCDHSAITSDLSGYFISKWGSVCLFQHKKEDTPYLIQPEGLMYFKQCREYYNQNITTDFTKEGCCEFILQNVTISNNADVVLKTKNYDDYKQINEFIQIDGPFEIQIGSTLQIQ